MPRPLGPKTPETQAERQARYRAAQDAAGGKRLQVMLSPEAVGHFALLRRAGETDKAAIERVLAEAAARQGEA